MNKVALVALALCVLALSDEAVGMSRLLRRDWRTLHASVNNAILSSSKDRRILCNDSDSINDKLLILRRNYDLPGNIGASVFEENYEQVSALCRQKCEDTCVGWMKNKLSVDVNDQVLSDFKTGCASEDAFATLMDSSRYGTVGKTLWDGNQACEDMGVKKRKKVISGCFKAVKDTCEQATQHVGEPLESVDTTKNEHTDDTSLNTSGNDEEKVAKGEELPHTACAIECADHFAGKEVMLQGMLCPHWENENGFLASMKELEYPPYEGNDACPGSLATEQVEDDLRWCYRKICI